MTIYEKGKSTRSSEREFRSCLMRFIRQAHAFEVATGMYAGYVNTLNGTDGHFSPFMVVQASAHEVAQNMALVNSCIDEIGGIAFTPSDFPLPKPLTLVS